VTGFRVATVRTLPACAACALACAVCLPANGQPTAAAPGAPVLTLARAVAQALAANERVLDARDALSEASLGLRVAKATFEPQLVPNVSGSFGHAALASQTVGIGLTQRFTTGTEVRGSTSATSLRNQLGAYYLVDTTLIVSQPLLRGFGREEVLQPVTTAQRKVADAERQRLLTEREVALDVASTYYGIVAEDAMGDAARKSLERARALVAASEAKLKAGLVSQLDVLRGRQLLTQAEADAVGAEALCEDARDRLRALMHADAQFVFGVEPAAPGVVAAVRLDDAVATALTHRPELARAADAVVASSLAVRLAADGLRPQFDLGVALTRQATGPTLSSSFRSGDTNLGAYANFSMPLVRTRERADRERALLDRERRLREQAALQTAIAQEVRAAVRRQERAARVLELAGAASDLAGKESEVARFRYQRGLSNNLDVVNAEANLLAAESRRIAASTELAIASLALRLAMGTLDPRQDFR
jgi:outer membrane protein